MRVALIETGLANVASVEAALGRLGVTPVRATGPDDVEDAGAAILPGVGAFGAGAAALADRGLAAPLARRIAENRPTLAICLGLQLLCAASDETPGAEGLGALPVRAQRLGAPRLPHFGWSEVTAPAGATVLASGAAYFAHTFALTDVSALERAGFAVATAVEGEPFAAAVERGPVVACQFHPELSGAYGAALLGRWLEVARGERADAARAGGVRRW